MLTGLLLITSFFVLIFGLFFSGNLIFGHKTDVGGTKIGDKVQQLGTKTTLIDTLYNPDEKEIYIAFSIPISDLNPLAKYSVSAKADKSTNDDLPTKIQKISEDKYVVYLKDIPRKWKKIGVEINDTQLEKSMTGTSKKIYLVNQGVPQTTEKIEKPAEYFEPIFTKVRYE